MISKEVKKIQNFNYHTHTKRCKHASKNYSDEDYVKEAIQSNLDYLAFTDHIPFKSHLDSKSNVRMDYNQKEDYINSILNLKEKYHNQIKIETGFEFEYFPQELDNIYDIKKQVDKMILGQHFIITDNGKIKYFNYLTGMTDREMQQYYESIKNALECNLPDIIAHPDLFLKFRSRFTEKERIISHQICKLAEQYQVPLELNLNEIYKMYEKIKYLNLSKKAMIKMIERYIPYPNKHFWEIAKEYNIKVLYGVDVHFKGQLSFRTNAYEIAEEILGETIQNLNFVDYNLK